MRNDSARQLRAGRSRTIALVVLDVANPFFTDVVRGAEAAAEEHGVIVVVCNSGEDAGRERRHLDLLEEQRVRGVLITPVDDSPNSRLELLIQRGTPVVLVDRGSGRRRPCSVAVDDVLGGRLAGDHLLEQGHQRIAFVGGPPPSPRCATGTRASRRRSTGRRRADRGRHPPTSPSPPAGPPARRSIAPAGGAHRRRSAPTTWSRSACCRA